MTDRKRQAAFIKDHHPDTFANSAQSSDTVISVTELAQLKRPVPRWWRIWQGPVLGILAAVTCAVVSGCGDSCRDSHLCRIRVRGHRHSLAGLRGSRMAAIPNAPPQPHRAGTCRHDCRTGWLLRPVPPRVRIVEKPSDGTCRDMSTLRSRQPRWRLCHSQSGRDKRLRMSVLHRRGIPGRSRNRIPTRRPYGRVSSAIRINRTQPRLWRLVSVLRKMVRISTKPTPAGMRSLAPSDEIVRQIRLISRPRAGCSVSWCGTPRDEQANGHTSRHVPQCRADRTPCAVRVRCRILLR